MDLLYGLLPSTRLLSILCPNLASLTLSANLWTWSVLIHNTINSGPWQLKSDYLQLRLQSCLYVSIPSCKPSLSLLLISFCHESPLTHFESLSTPAQLPSSPLMCCPLLKVEPISILLAAALLCLHVSLSHSFHSSLQSIPPIFPFSSTSFLLLLQITMSSANTLPA